MKKYLLPLFTSILTVCLFSAAQAQNKAIVTKKQTASEKQKNAEANLKEEVKSKKDGKLGIIVAGSNEYHEIKAKGLLHQYEIKDAPKRASGTIIFNSGAAKTASVTTPCDFPPIQGPDPFPGDADDDAFTISIPFNFCFYGVNYNAVNFTDNGNIQFATNSTIFTSTGFPSNTVNMIAPFWCDPKLNVTVGGVLYGRFHYDIYPTKVIFSWDSLPYYQGLTTTDVSKLNSFQVVITDGTDPILPPGKNVGFYYRRMEWTTGNASGGTGGFPTTQPGNPATIGANQGNGVDYFQLGRFGVPGTFYDGPFGNNDGVAWLTGKKFFYNVCPPVGANQEPSSTKIQYCDTFRVCGNDTLYKEETFIAPEPTQTTTVTASAPSLGSSFTYSAAGNGNAGSIYMVINGSTAPAGYHTITMTATDNGTPALTSVQTFVVYVDQASANNLNGSIAITPTIGACPGGVVTTTINLSGGTPDSFYWSNGVTTPSTSYTIQTGADSLVYVTLTSGQCQKTIIGDVNVNPVPVASISGNLQYCSSDGPSTILTATNSLNPATQGPHTYTWTASVGTIGSANSASTTLTAGMYTVTVANQFGCTSTAAATVTANEGPIFTLTNNSTFADTVYCATLDSARFAFHYAAASTAACGLSTSGCTTSTNVIVGNGTTNTSATATTPYAHLWGNTRHQYLIKASELASNGAVAGKLSSLSFSISAVSGLNNYPNFTIKLKCTSANVATSSFDNVGLVQVYSANSPITTGINTYNFTQPYIWDGVSNLLVDICHDVVPFTSSSSVSYSATPFVSVTYDYDDNNPLCGSTATGFTSSNRPNMIFGHCLAQQLPSQFNVAVSPTTGVVVSAAKDSIKIDLPPGGTTQCYTLTVTNPSGGCAKDTVICVYTDQGITNATFVASTNSVCIGSPVTLTASGAPSYTVNYMQNGTPVFLSNTATTIHTPVQQGLNVYSLTAQGNCGAAPAGYTVGVIVVPTANLVISPLVDVTKCMNRDFVFTTGVSSTNSNPGTPYSYAWTTLPGNVPAPGNNTASSYTCSSNVTTTLVLTVNGTCATGDADTVVVSNLPNDLAISITDSASICANSQYMLHTFTSGGYPDYHYAWTMGTDPTMISNGPDLSYMTPGQQGVYQLMVMVTDSCGYAASDVQLINVLPPCTVEIPNVITPNGDGVNDVFIIKNLEYHPGTSVNIFDRWGRKVYSSSYYNNDFKGGDLSDGTYFYVIDVPDDKGYSGFMTIFKGK